MVLVASKYSIVRPLIFSLCFLMFIQSLTQLLQRCLNSTCSSLSSTLSQLLLTVIFVQQMKILPPPHTHTHIYYQSPTHSPSPLPKPCIFTNIKIVQAYSRGRYFTDLRRNISCTAGAITNSSQRIRKFSLRQNWRLFPRSVEKIIFLKRKLFPGCDKHFSVADIFALMCFLSLRFL